LNEKDYGRRQRILGMERKTWNQITLYLPKVVIVEYVMIDEKKYNIINAIKEI